MNTLSIMCVLVFLLAIATLVFRSKYLSTKTTRSQALLGAAIVFALVAFDKQSIMWLGIASICYLFYVRRLYRYLKARRISERYGAPCPKHREA